MSGIGIWETPASRICVERFMAVFQITDQSLAAAMLQNPQLFDPVNAHLREMVGDPYKKCSSLEKPTFDPAALARLADLNEKNMSALIRVMSVLHRSPEIRGVMDGALIRSILNWVGKESIFDHLDDNYCLPGEILPACSDGKLLETLKSDAKLLFPLLLAELPEPWRALHQLQYSPKAVEFCVQSTSSFAVIALALKINENLLPFQD